MKNAYINEINKIHKQLNRIHLTIITMPFVFCFVKLFVFEETNQPFEKLFFVDFFPFESYRK